MKSILTPLFVAMAIAACAPAGAKEMKRDRKVEAPDYWMTDLEAALTKARGEGKPLFVVFRCDP